MQAFLRTQAAAGFRGHVLVARGARVLVQQPVGGASRGPVAYWLGSTTKQFTAAAVLKLAEQGRLRVTDPLARFFPAAPADKRAMTLHHLLTHTSGLGDRYSADGQQQRDRAVRAILSQPLAGPVGQSYRYSSDGYCLLAAVVEVASGTSFEQYVRTALLQPAGLAHTGFWGQPLPAGVPLAPAQDAQRARRVSRRVYARGQSRANYGYRGATGMCSTTADLFGWLQALRSAKVLSDSSLRQLFAPAVAVRREKDVDVSYAYGWVVTTQNGQTQLVRHAGAEDWLGHNSFILLGGETTVVVLSNAGEPGGNAWSRTMAEGLWPLVQAP
ncbi:beta-lactamase family protein [Hymenobacter sp. BT175]|uniref:serine hydrolase domain-containing protein n=1 Tax=Hymenobacter translucens TaxID=2886507 RepID=UPI001D0DFD4B|nr:serine hydrolase domain-containing protein [Hymenobacter translucens]MCC2545497.1 beta-lactamase family protein [Hymenobacter translucens]